MPARCHSGPLFIRHFLCAISFTHSHSIRVSPFTAKTKTCFDTWPALDFGISQSVRLICRVFSCFWYSSSSSLFDFFRRTVQLNTVYLLTQVWTPGTTDIVVMCYDISYTFVHISISLHVNQTYLSVQLNFGFFPFKSFPLPRPIQRKRRFCMASAAHSGPAN